MNNNTNVEKTPPTAGGGPATPTIVKPVAIKSSSPSNIAECSSRGSSDGSTSPTVVSSSHEFKSTKEVNSGFNRIIPVSEIFKRSGDKISSDFISHQKTYAFMNWIPVDRSPEYLSEIFKNLRITNDASFVLKTAYDKRASAGSRPVSRPHNIGYITIPANSIIDSVQGKAFLEAIQSAKYQVILDCGEEPAELSNWEYRVYPTKKKLLPSEVPATDLPPLGCITISMDNAVYTSDKSQGRSSYRAGGFLSDNISDVSSIALSDSCANDVMNQTDNNIKLSITQPAQMQINKTFANVARINSEPPTVRSVRSSNIEVSEVCVSPFSTIKRRPWADMSTSDEDNNSHITHTTASATASAATNAIDERKTDAAADATTTTATDADSCLIDGNIKLTENIKDLYEKSVAKVTSKQKLSDDSYAKWQSCQEALTKAKAEQSHLQHLLDLITGFKDDEGNGDDDLEEQELCVNTGNVGNDYNSNNNCETGNVISGSAATYDSNYIIDPHSGQVTPILYYQPNVDGSYSPVLPAPSQNWFQFNASPPYGPPPTQYSGQNNNNIGQQSHHNVTTPVSTPVVTPSNATRKIPVQRNENISRNHMSEANAAANATVTSPISRVPLPEPAAIIGTASAASSNNVEEEKESADGADVIVAESQDQTTVQVAQVSPESRDEEAPGTTSLRGRLEEFIDMNNISSDQLKTLFQQLESSAQHE